MPADLFLLVVLALGALLNHLALRRAELERQLRQLGREPFDTLARAMRAVGLSGLEAAEAMRAFGEAMSADRTS